MQNENNYESSTMKKPTTFGEMVENEIASKLKAAWDMGRIYERNLILKIVAESGAKILLAQPDTLGWLKATLSDLDKKERENDKNKTP